MSNVGKITVKKIEDLKDAVDTKYVNVFDPNPPAEDIIELALQKTKVVKSLIHTKSRRKFVKKTPPDQRKIDQYFSITKKTYDISAPVMGNSPLAKMNAAFKKTTQKIFSDDNNGRGSTRKVGLFNVNRYDCKDEDGGESFTWIANINAQKLQLRSQPARAVKMKAEYTIDLLTDSDESTKNENVLPNTSSHKKCETLSEHTKSLPMRLQNVNCLPNSSSANLSVASSSSIKTGSTSTRPQKRRGCKMREVPPYKVIEGTTFAVDAFNYGNIPNVTHYFLTHYHSDHYMGLKSSFSMPLYASPLTLRLVRTLIKTNAQYLHELKLNETININDVEVTALDANHCPGAVMFFFRLKTGKCILHTGDFRANYLMESEPIFWDHNIDLLYLDTTYLPAKYDFPTQEESIQRAVTLIHDFQIRSSGKRILYVFGSYIIGKEKVWIRLAKHLGVQVRTDKERQTVFLAQENPDINSLLRLDAQPVGMHIIPLTKVHYNALNEYFTYFEKEFDVLLAFRPSGWERNNKPQYRGKINIIPIEYSEHSGYSEIERFVKFIKPKTVISTVPTGSKDVDNSLVPRDWYEYSKLQPNRRYQQHITNYTRVGKRFYGQNNSNSTSANSNTHGRTATKRMNTTPIDFSLKKPSF